MKQWKSRSCIEDFVCGDLVCDKWLKFETTPGLPLEHSLLCTPMINNYWTRFSMILRISRSWWLRWITQTKALTILDIMRTPNPVTEHVFLCIQNNKKPKSNTNGTHEHFMPCRLIHTTILYATMFLKQLSDSTVAAEAI